MAEPLGIPGQQRKGVIRRKRQRDREVIYVVTHGGKNEVRKKKQWRCSDGLIRKKTSCEIFEKGGQKKATMIEDKGKP